MTISILDIGIEKSIFQLHGAGPTGKAVFEKRLPRHQLAAYVNGHSGIDGGKGYLVRDNLPARFDVTQFTALVKYAHS